MQFFSINSGCHVSDSHTSSTSGFHQRIAYWNYLISSEIPWLTCHVKDPRSKSQSSASAQVSTGIYVVV